MQLSLSPPAEQLLRQALARNPTLSLESLVEQALAELLGQGAASSSGANREAEPASRNA